MFFFQYRHLLFEQKASAIAIGKDPYPEHITTEPDEF